MSRPPASPSPAGAGGPWLPGMHGLRVAFGHQNKLGRWIRQPTADFTCRHGCAHTASGPEAVAQFTAAIDQHHARHCPGLTTQEGR